MEDSTLQREGQKATVGGDQKIENETDMAKQLSSMKNITIREEEEKG